MAKEPKETPQPADSAPEALPDLIYAQASPHSVGGISMFDADGRINAQNVANFESDDGLSERAVLLLQDAGFTVLQVTPSTINIAGPPAAYERAFEARLFTEERPVIKPGKSRTTSTFIESPTAERPGLISTEGTRFAELLEGVAIEEPATPFAANPMAPTQAYWHLDVPADVSLGCNADQAHRGGITGAGVKVAMVRQRPFRPPVLRRARLSRRPGRARPRRRQSARRREWPRHRRVGEHLRRRARRAAASGQDELRQQHRRVQRGGRAGAGHHHLQLGQQQSRSARSARPIRRSPPRSPTAVASGIIVVFSAGNGHFGFPGPASRRDLRRRRVHGRRRGAAGLGLFERLRQQHLPRPQRARRQRPGRHAAAGRLHHAAARAGLTRSTSTLAGGGAHPNGDETRQQRRLGGVQRHVGRRAAAGRRRRADQAGLPAAHPGRGARRS